MTISEDENTGLIHSARNDPDAFAQLYLMYYDNVFHYCIRRLFDRNAAEEATSTIFFKVMHNLSSFDGTVIDFRSWLFRIATNAINDYLRDAKKRKDIIHGALTNNQSQTARATDYNEKLLEKKALLKKALLKLKPKYQTVITLRFFENMKLTEIAACLGKNPSTVRTWLNRATEKLRRKLNAAMDNGG